MHISGVHCIQKQTMKRPPGTSFVIGGTCFSFSNLAVSAVVFHFSEVLFTWSSLPKQDKTKQHISCFCDFKAQLWGSNFVGFYRDKPRFKFETMDIFKVWKFKVYIYIHVQIEHNPNI